MSEVKKFSIFGVIREAWREVKGFKGPLNVGLLLSGLVVLGFAILLAIGPAIAILPHLHIDKLGHTHMDPHMSGLNYLWLIIPFLGLFPLCFLSYLFTTSSYVMSYDFIKGCEVKARDIFHNIRHGWSVIGTVLMLIIMAGCVSIGLYIVFQLPANIVAATIAHKGILTLILLFLLSMLYVTLKIAAMILLGCIHRFATLRVMLGQGDVFESLGNAINVTLKNWYRFLGLALMLLLPIILPMGLAGLLAFLTASAKSAWIIVPTALIIIALSLGVIVSFVWYMPFYKNIFGILYRDLFTHDETKIAHTPVEA